jgi:hypothetical protein
MQESSAKFCPFQTINVFRKKAIKFRRRDVFSSTTLKQQQQQQQQQKTSLFSNLKKSEVFLRSLEGKKLQKIGLHKKQQPPSMLSFKTSIPWPSSNLKDVVFKTHNSD